MGSRQRSQHRLLLLRYGHVLLPLQVRRLCPHLPLLTLPSTPATPTLHDGTVFVACPTNAFGVIQK